MTNITKLADRLGSLLQEQAEIAELIAAAKAEILDTGETKIDGVDFTATVTAASSPWILDTKAIVAEMGEAWVTSHSKISHRAASVRCKRKLVSKEAAA